jgi:hypothetical protein
MDWLLGSDFGVSNKRNGAALGHKNPLRVADQQDGIRANADSDQPQGGIDYSLCSGAVSKIGTKCPSDEGKEDRYFGPIDEG